MIRYAATFLALSLAGVLLAQEPSPQRPAPYFDARRHPTEYVGPGRELPEPVDVADVPLAYMGPADDAHPDWGDAWRGARLAIEEVNAAGGYRGKPFRLLPAWSENPWGTGVSQLARHVYADGVWAIVGGVDAVSTHLAEQIVVKALLAQVSFGNTDPSVHLTNVPWVFGLAPTDDTLAPIVAQAVLRRVGSPGRWAALTATDHDSHVTWCEVSSALSQRLALAPVLHVEVTPEDEPDAQAAADVCRAGVPVVVVVARAREAARLVGALREAGFQGAIVGGATLGRRPFLEEAGADAEGVVFPLLFDADRAPSAFTAAYRGRFGAEPDWLAAHAYDAVRLVAAAVREAGLNRVRIQDALRAIVPWDGVTGRIAWDATGRRVREIGLGTIRAGRVVPAEE